MAKNRKKQVKKAVAKKAPAKARAMSSAEIRLKNEQAKLNKEIKKAEKAIDKIRALSDGNPDKKILEAGRKHKRKAKTAINAVANTITKLRTQLSETTLSRQIISKGAYKPKTSNVNPLDKMQKASSAKRGVRTIGTYLAWMRNDAVRDLLENNTIFKTKVKTIDGNSPSKDMDKILNSIDGTFNFMNSSDILIAKIDLKTGAIFFEIKIGGYNPLEESEDEES